ncbi:hypothetical protein FH608_032385 [Nonomuraea phyllanthi]|uniref:Uncharacterized protein n=1 Tax=Nonomuraea phyllanthi TaxID=2219224 RepID=A0A5C4VB17_9ACTN|nr:hypothetical protein FH608_032385 [Nonomuraea phyllanthi]
MGGGRRARLPGGRRRGGLPGGRCGGLRGGLRGGWCGGFRGGRGSRGGLGHGRLRRDGAGDAQPHGEHRSRREGDDRSRS